MRFRRVVALCLAVFALAAADIATAATDSHPTARAIAKRSSLPSAMTVTLIKDASPGCSPACPEWIAAEGMITSGTMARFKNVLDRIGDRKIPVLVNSLGGSVPDAYAVGRLIRTKGLDVAVGATEFSPCRESEAECARLAKDGIKFGTSHATNAKCVSACPFLLAAGVRRVVTRNTIVGVHEFASYQTTIRILRKYQVTTKHSFWGPDEKTKKLISEKKVGESTKRVETRAADYEKARKYFVEMGVSEAIMPLVHKAHYESLHVLTPSELTETRLMTEQIALDELLASVKPAEAAKSFAKPAEPIAAVRSADGVQKKGAAAPARKRSARMTP